MTVDGRPQRAPIPEQLVVDYDYTRPCPPGEDPLVACARLLDGPPVVWSERNGGHWIVARGEIAPKVLEDWQHFSSERVFIGLDGRPRAVPLEYDPPEHGPLRKLLAPAFTPKSVARWADEARDLARQLIAAIEPRGECEFVGEFARHLPMIIILRMLDLPLDHREMLVGWVDASLRATDPVTRADTRNAMNAYIGDLVDRRTADPGDDVLSQAILTGGSGGRPLDRDLALGLTSSVIGGGLDTVATTMSWIAWHLAQHREHRVLLRENPRRIPAAIQEFLRRFAISNIARVVREDMEFHGAPLKAGDAILVQSALRSLDPSIFPDPFKVDFDRVNAREHTTLSYGPHRCIGAALANQELILFLEQWLTHIPDFGLAEHDPVVFAAGIVPGIERLHLAW